MMIDRQWLIRTVRDAQAGKMDAAGALYEAFNNSIYGYIYDTVKDRELAADLTQDTFIEVMEKLHYLKEPAAFVTWSRQIAFSRCTAYFRKRKEILFDENDDQTAMMYSAGEAEEVSCPIQLLERADVNAAIMQMLKSLPEEQRNAMFLRYYKELSVADIANIQGVTEGTVKSRLNYGRKAMKYYVERYEEQNGIRLHSVAILPLLLFLFRNQKLSSGQSLTDSKLPHAGGFSAVKAAAQAKHPTGASSQKTTAVKAAAAGKTASASVGAIVALLATAVSVIFLSMFFIKPNNSAQAGGSSEPSKHVIQISNEADLRNIERNPDGDYILVNDIDLSKTSNWTPLCTSTTPFTGTLDGNGYCIRNITVDITYNSGNSDSQYAGLFRCVSGATIKNLGIVGGTVCISSSSYGDGVAGALAGKSTYRYEGQTAVQTEVSNCWINARVESHVIENGGSSYSATMAIGAFFGEGSANFTNCYNLGVVAAATTYADQNIGGFIGEPYVREQCPMTIKSCYNFGVMSARYVSGNKLGAFIGDGVYNQHIDMIDSYYGTVPGDEFFQKDLEIAMTDKWDDEFTSVKGLTVEQMKSQSNFSGFDFNNTWAISPGKNDGYPYLKVQKSVD